MKIDINFKYFFLFLFTLTIVMASLLVGPRVPAEDQTMHCVDNIKIGKYFGISLNCDSSEFMLLANQPELLLENESIRQSRPGLIYAAAIFTNLIKSVIPNYKNNLSNIEVIEKTSKTNKTRLIKNGPAYSAYILLNIIIASVSFILMLNIINKEIKNNREINLEQSKLPITFIFGLICFLLANDVIKAFAWSPHTQYFNILGPILSVWCISRVLNGGLESFTQQNLISFLTLKLSL